MQEPTEQRLLDLFNEAIATDAIFPCYQAQINHSTGRLVGAEALMRWKHEDGFLSPSFFIPILEKHDLIFKADMHLFDMVCRFQRHCLDEGIHVVPISVNMSRYDIFRHDYVEDIEAVRQRYDIPVQYLRIEITESSAIGGMELITSVLTQLHEKGYLVEMDDFGSGYSSLNILKDLSVDIIKLDMNFLSGKIGGRGGIIISSVVQMAKWLGTPVIAEGVETREQADYMKSIGCNYIQGFLYAKPIPGTEFIDKLTTLQHEPMKSAMNLVKTMDAGKFWNPDSMETLIFSNFVGAACIFTYTLPEGKVEILRVNHKYVVEIGMNLTEKEIIGSNPWDNHKTASRADYERAIKKAIETNDEVTFETWRDFHSPCCGDDSICVRSSIRVIGKAGTQYLIYAMIHNVTAEKKAFDSVAESERRFRFASEQLNLYAWEYTIATKEMRPCFRCMRDLNLPPLIENYPEPLIESGVFPADYADFYRDMMKKIDEGAPSLDAIIPLTTARIPFHIRYTTEFDETGRPLKAYGSAALIEDEEKKKS